MYFKINEEDGLFKIAMTSKFYEVMAPHYQGNSYITVLYRLYNLLPQDFYHYVGYKFHASFKKNAYLNSLIDMFFVNKADAKLFCDDLNSRFSYCIKIFME